MHVDTFEYRARSLARHLYQIAVFLLLFGSFSPVFAQRDLPPEKGGMTYELGMPPVYKGRAGVEAGMYRPKTSSALSGYFNAGLAKDLGSPVVGIAGIRVEGYLGTANQEFDGGGRALFEIPSFLLGLGVDYNSADHDLDFLLAMDFPVVRGGLLGRGTTLGVRWLPTRDQTFSVGINLPLWGRNLGKTRPRQDHVRLDKRNPRRVEIDSTVTDLETVLLEIRDRADWIVRLTQPFAEHSGADPHAAMKPVLDELKAHMAIRDEYFPAGHTLPAEVQAYHRALDRAFSVASGKGEAAGAKISAKAREVLLDEVIFPYNHLLGQRKTEDSLVGMIAIAQTEFAGWILPDLDLDREAERRVFFVFQTLCDIAEQNRRSLKARWEDSRFVWLSLQLALKPDQHDSQAELDDLIARASGHEFTAENRVWYVINEEFQWEMARSVREAEDYHVLWIHDFRGRNGEGMPDAIAYAHTLNYLETLIERVESYDETGKLPQYFVFLDQHYFEINKSRLWLRLLLDPLDHDLNLPADRSEWEEKIDATQQKLRAAVAGSEMLKVGASQFGEAWLKNQIKVHVNITNPADHSFRSWHIAGILPIPDNMMRDHRKIAFYDITEADPYRGIAMFTGMGIGEHYVGPEWEDRAIMIQGPGALEVKDAARGLLVAQGYDPHEIPYPLRKLEKPRDYEAMIAAERDKNTPAWLEDRGSVLQLHSETGFHDKPINAAKAVLYSLMPPGSVLQVPDSLWQSYIYASLLSGSALRGCRVLVIAPTEDSAPSDAAPTLARAHGLMGRLIVFSNAMDDEIVAQDGLLQVGLYAPKQGVADIAGRIQQAIENSAVGKGRVFRENPSLMAVAASTGAMLDSLGYQVEYLFEDSEETKPKIHLKANFMASRVAWDALHGNPKLGDVFREYIVYLAGQVGVLDDEDETPDVRAVPEKLKRAWFRFIQSTLLELTPEERRDLVYYFTVGSTNMDYRSMVMDGEVMVVVGGWQALHGYIDFLLLPGLCEWLETTEELDALLPPPSGLTRSMAGLLKLSL